jgi:Family of unknown function (DUF6174)
MRTSKIVGQSAPGGGVSRRSGRGWFGGLLFGVLALGAAACSNDADVAADKLLNWRENGPASYTYVVQTTCFCSGVEPVRVMVEDGVVVQAVGLRSGVPRFDLGGTMTELLESTVRLAKTEPDRFEATYEPGLGYLLRLDVDERTGWADDEVSISVSCFSESTAAEACPLPTVSRCDGTFRAVDPTDALSRTCLDGTSPKGRREGGEEVCCPAPELFVESTEACSAQGGSVIQSEGQTPSCWAPEAGRDLAFRGVVRGAEPEAVCCSSSL